MEDIGSQTAVVVRALLCFQVAQTDLAGLSDRRTSSFFLIFLTWLVGSETNTGKKKEKTLNIFSNKKFVGRNKIKALLSK